VCRLLESDADIPVRKPISLIELAEMAGNKDIPDLLLKYAQ
jgi:hypothetical protein